MIEAEKDRARGWQQEQAALERLGVRWAVLFAWHQDLSRRAPSVPRDVARKLETAKIKISSDCFSSCEVGCELREIEAALTSADASLDEEKVDWWLSRLSRSMEPASSGERLLQAPAPKIYFNDCRARGCSCAQ